MLPDMTAVAQQFLTSPDALTTGGTGFAQAANDLRNWLHQQYYVELGALSRYIIANGGTLRHGMVQVEYVADQPYPLKVAAMRKSVLNSGVLRISTEGNQPDLAGWYGNLELRAIHDAHHILLWPHAPFNYAGESFATAYMLTKTTNPVFQDMLYSEGAAQTAIYYHTGDYLPAQKVVMGWKSTIAQLMDHFGYQNVATNTTYALWR